VTDDDYTVPAEEEEPLMPLLGVVLPSPERVEYLMAKWSGCLDILAEGPND
jgi:hypothetical protein